MSLVNIVSYFAPKRKDASLCGGTRVRAYDSANRIRDFGPASGVDVDFPRCSFRPWELLPTHAGEMPAAKIGSSPSPDRTLHQARTRISPHRSRFSFLYIVRMLRRKRRGGARRFATDGEVTKTREEAHVSNTSLRPADKCEAGKREAGLRQCEKLVASPRSFRQTANAVSAIRRKLPRPDPTRRRLLKTG